MKPAIKEDIGPFEFALMGIILALAEQRYDTCDIARKVGCKESQVYNLLSRVKEGQRNGNEQQI